MISGRKIQEQKELQNVEVMSECRQTTLTYFKNTKAEVTKVITYVHRRGCFR